MAELTAYGKDITNVFQLIGNKEDDITKSVAWALKECPAYAKCIFDSVLKIDCDPSKLRISFQYSEKDKGRTDLEVTDDDLFYVIIEAKRGWILPDEKQLELYSNRRELAESSARNKAIITMSECSEEYAALYLPFSEINKIPVTHISWKSLRDYTVASRSKSNNKQKIILRQLADYLGGLMTMQQKETNWVYVVSLSTKRINGSALSWIDIVEKKKRYFHPMGGGRGGWPKEAVNYIAFRYAGQLQSIHHVESYIVARNPHTEIPELPNEEWDTDHFIYRLGPAIKPSKVVKTGKIYPSGRKWAMIDTLLTSNTILEASEISYKRRDGE